ncbi:9257_t:CDS:2 [Acaulospora morrowiae]|uniref:9257_t:CDS:1 n=1 Tax=Acaulospora morrowiae TaxID=94023 RepID=A0A9N9FG07_9GLOM|nr:9257_t:CDS:2 [Acaulospora morrowiae]
MKTTMFLGKHINAITGVGRVYSTRRPSMVSNGCTRLPMLSRLSLVPSNHILPFLTPGILYTSQKRMLASKNKAQFIKSALHFFLAILEMVNVPCKDGSAPLKDLAQVVVKDPQTLLVHVHDEEMLKAVDKAIRIANLNLNPMVHEKGLSVTFPKVTTEYREKLVKAVSEISERTKIKVRLVRQDGLKSLKKDMKIRLSNDELKASEKKLQLLIDNSIKDIDEISKAKSKEIMEN